MSICHVQSDLFSKPLLSSSLLHNGPISKAFDFYFFFFFLLGGGGCGGVEVGESRRGGEEEGTLYDYISPYFHHLFPAITGSRTDAARL